jgi:hypothetical protein
MKRTIEANIENLLAISIINSEFKENDIIFADISENKEKIFKRK